MENSVQAIMSKKLETIDIIDSAQKAAQLMKNSKIGSILVVDMKTNPSEPLGIVTERDFVYRICASGLDSKDVAVGEIMSAPIATTTPTATIEGTATLMLKNKVRHLLVVDGEKKPIGIVGPSDLYRYLKANLDLDEVNARILSTLLEDGEMGPSTA